MKETKMDTSKKQDVKDLALDVSEQLISAKQDVKDPALDGSEQLISAKRDVKDLALDVSQQLISTKQDVKDLALDGLEQLLSTMGKERYRARQIMKWVYRRGASTFEEMTDLSKGFREEIGEIARISELAMDDVLTSSDGTKKILFRLEDGNHVESVLIREKNHWTQCISTQVGCAMACAFCLTGRFGFTRNLHPSEIAGQISAVRKTLPEGKDVKSIVMMGMGEPLLNCDNVLRAIEIITSDHGLAISKRRITVSTCGIVPNIDRLGREACVNLAVSLNASDNEKRNRLMPVNRKYPLEELVRACCDYPMPRRRMITFEYILIRDINDSLRDARKLAFLLQGIHCKFNLIPFNEFPESPFKRPSKESIRQFRDFLVDKSFTATIRPSKGDDILAACGQLSGQKMNPGETPSS